jgi:chorismate--pyruvate lyase
MKDRVFYDQCPRKYQSSLAKWRDYRQVKLHIPSRVRPWLLDEGSLTERLVRASGGQFQVQLLRQCWGAPTADERITLGMAQREVALLRETILMGRQQAWVYARSVIPAATLTGHNRCLRSLGNRSLGSWLFQAHDMQRSPFQVSLLAPDNVLVPAELQQDQHLWGRRSRFEVSGAALLVCEIFLPRFKPWPMINRIPEQAPVNEHQLST